MPRTSKVYLYAFFLFAFIFLFSPVKALAGNITPSKLPNGPFTYSVTQDEVNKGATTETRTLIQIENDERVFHAISMPKVDLPKDYNIAYRLYDKSGYPVILDQDGTKYYVDLYVSNDKETTGDIYSQPVDTVTFWLPWRISDLQNPTFEKSVTINYPPGWKGSVVIKNGVLYLKLKIQKTDRDKPNSDWKIELYQSNGKKITERTPSDQLSEDPNDKTHIFWGVHSFSLDASDIKGLMSWDYYFKISSKGPFDVTSPLTTYHIEGEVNFHLTPDGKIIIGGKDTGFSVNNLTQDNTPIVMGIDETATSAMDFALNKIMELFSRVVSALIAAIGSLISPFLFVGSLLKQNAIISSWTKVRDVANILLVLGLLIIALTNALRIQLDYYNAKVLLPRLLIAAILINFSLLMTQAIVDLANVLTAVFISQTALTNVVATNSDASGLMGVLGGLTVSAIALFFFGWLVLIVFAIAIGLMLILLIMRIALLWVLAVTSPLVFLLAVLPFTRGLTKMWWTYFTKYAFMAPIMALVLMVAAEINRNPAGTPSLGGVPGVVNGVNITDSVIKLLVVAALIFVASLIPLLMGDKLAGAVSGKVGDWTRGLKKSKMAQSRGGAAILARRKFKEQEAGLKAMQRMAGGTALSRRLGETGWGQKLGFASDEQRARIKNEVFQKLAKQSEGMDKKVAQDALRPFAKMTGLTADGHEIWELDQSKKAAFLGDLKSQAILHSALMKPDLANDNNESEFKYIDDMQGLMTGIGNGNFIPASKKLGAAAFWNLAALRAGNAGTVIAIGKTGYRTSPEAASSQSSTNYDKLFDEHEALQRVASEVVVKDSQTGERMNLGQAANEMINGFIEHKTPGQIDAEFEAAAAGGTTNLAKLMRIYKPFLTEDKYGNVSFNTSRSYVRDTLNRDDGRKTLQAIKRKYTQVKQKGGVAKATFTRPEDTPPSLGGPGPGSGGARTGWGE